MSQRFVRLHLPNDALEVCSYPGRIFHAIVVLEVVTGLWTAGQTGGRRLASTAVSSSVEVCNLNFALKRCLLIVGLLVAGLLRHLWRELHGLVQLKIRSFTLYKGDRLARGLIYAWLWLLVRRMLLESSLARLDILDDLFVNRLV